MTLWYHMAHLELSVLEKVLRTAIVYVFLVAGLRLAGKRELAQLNPFDLIVLLLLSNTVQNAIIGRDDSLTGGLIGAATLLGLNALVVRFLYGHARLERLIEGDAEVLMDHGVILPERLRAEHITSAELEAAARRQGFASLGDVERAVLEPTGTLSFVPARATPERTRHEELVRRLEGIERVLATIRETAAGGGPAPR